MESPAAEAVGKAVVNVDYSDYIILALVAIATVAWFTKGKLWSRPKQDHFAKAQPHAADSRTRDIVKKMQDSDKNAVVFYGSQTGTAEDYATRLAKEGHQKYGLRTMTADMEEYDYENLDQFPKDNIAFFVVATYGEGEPTDNSVGFFEYIQDESSTYGDKSAEEEPLSNMKFVAFGLGNKTYEHYNEMVKICDRALSNLGATRIGEYGMGDDADGTMEEDFISWKDDMWETLAKTMGLEEREATYEPSFSVTEEPELSVESESVFLGEPSKKHLLKTSKPFNANNPFLAQVSSSKELFKVKDRNCLHIELDIENSGMKYRSGDHIAVWPINPDQEVDRILSVLGLQNIRDTVIKVKALDTTSKVPVPQPTTYSAVFRYYLEICGPVSRQFLSTLVHFCPNAAAKDEVLRLSQDKSYFQSKVALPHLNLSQMMTSITKDKWNVPFSVFLESLGRLQPRYYSISSSHVLSPKTISITATVESKKFENHENVLNGVTTNYLLALSQAKNGTADPHPYGVSYNIDGPRSKYSGLRVPVHVRQSNFKLPMEAAIPIIMVGPGTGVAPFRAFVQERALQARNGVKVGKTILFYGCRKRNEDYLYEEEWETYKKDLGDAFEIDVAFSRDTNKKIYVQHRLAERAAEIKDILQTGYFYVCGDAAHMARDVNTELIKILGEDAVKKLKTSQRHQEDVWS